MTDGGQPTFGAIVLAAGSGTRFGRPKQNLELGGMELWQHSVATLTAAGIDAIVLVGDVPGGVPGGERRRDSVAAGLAHIDEVDWVLVHDAARPLVSEDVVARILGECRVTEADAVIPAVPVTDTVKRVDDRTVVETVDRTVLVTVQTPQAVRLKMLRSAHAYGPASNATDDAALVEGLGGKVVIVDGDPDNIKITYPRDLARAEAILRQRMA